MGNPSFLLIELAGEHADQVNLPRSLADSVKRRGGHCLAQAAAGRVACLEPGSIGVSMVVAKFQDRAALRSAVEETLLPQLRAALPGHSTPLILGVEGLPEEGLVDLLDVPTAASVPRPAEPARCVFLVVRGSASDATRMEAYRDVILPMHKERGGYYEVFALNTGQVTAFSGTWTEQIFAISRWPSRAAAEDFWFCDRYQQAAIPLRLGAGQFTVHLIEAAAP